jgi:hypothetical protein
VNPRNRPLRLAASAPDTVDKLGNNMEEFEFLSESAIFLTTDQLKKRLPFQMLRITLLVSMIMLI